MATTNAIGYLNASAHGRFFVPANLGRLYSGGNTAAAAAALSAGLSATYTGGLVLYNPLINPNTGLANTINLAINEAKFGFTLAQTNPAAIALGVGYGGTGTSILTPGTPIPSVPNAVGYPSTTGVSAQGPAVGQLYSPTSATLPATPVIVRQLGIVGTGPTTGTTLPFTAYTPEGGIILLPGAFCCFVSTAAGTASSFMGQFVWEELPAGAQ